MTKIHFQRLSYVHKTACGKNSVDLQKTNRVNEVTCIPCLRIVKTWLEEEKKSINKDLKYCREKLGRRK